ncbi:MAG: hypothetical protein PF590_05290 [Candidatus Delongbacteria bacterium]|jgi:predicted RND superfamily exporter protein|nr:hypothetical protein [Candidatus Delongbacteria bacterium]
MENRLDISNNMVINLTSWFALGITIIGGLLVSMINSLMVIPSLYALFYRKNIINEKTDKKQQA